MKAKIFTLFFLLSGIVVYAQNYPNVSVRDIQYVPDSLLALGQDASPYLDDTVRVTGVVVVSTLVHPTFDRRPIMWAGGRWQTYIVDTAYTETDFVALNIIQNDTTSPAAQQTLMDLLDTTMIVTITGVVAEFAQQTQLNVLLGEEIQFHGSKPNRKGPLELNISDFGINNTTGVGDILLGEKYEGEYVIFRNVTVSDRATSTTTANQFSIRDSDGNRMLVYDQSGYFTRRAHQLRVWEPPLNGTSLLYIRGVIGQFDNPPRYILRPMYPDDMLIGHVPPSITQVQRNSDLILPNQSVTISAVILPNPGGQISISEAKIRYRVNSGTLNEVEMTPLGFEDRWSGTIPGVPNDSALVDFYIWAKDNLDSTAVFPADTVRNKFFYLVLNRDLKIQDLQYSPFGGGFGAYHGYSVTVSGVVTADTTDLQGDGGSIGKRVYIQNGEGPWSGIWIFGLLAEPLVRGQHVTVTGAVRDDFSHTRIESITDLVVNSSGNPLPAPHYVSTSNVGTLAKGTVSAEQWEGVLIKYENLTVTNSNADGASNFGEMLAADQSNVSTRVELQEGNHPYHNLWNPGLDSIPGNIRIRTGDTFVELRGVLFYSFGNYKLVPRKEDDFIGHSTSVYDVPGELPAAYQLMQNYPNPFNPVTTIEYSIPLSGFVQVKIFDILGREIKSMVNREQSAGNYKVLFDASDLSSGVYLYQVKAGDFIQTKKMILMK